jgi:hypothetical protein
VENQQNCAQRLPTTLDGWFPFPSNAVLQKREAGALRNRLAAQKGGRVLLAKGGNVAATD